MGSVPVVSAEAPTGRYTLGLIVATGARWLYVPDCRACTECAHPIGEEV
jgi:hypothetical protein